MIVVRRKLNRRFLDFNWRESRRTNFYKETNGMRVRTKQTNKLHLLTSYVLVHSLIDRDDRLELEKRRRRFFLNFAARRIEFLLRSIVFIYDERWDILSRYVRLFEFQGFELGQGFANANSSL